MKRVFFTGAGGVGKTAVVAAFQEELAFRGIPSRTMLSVSRAFFKARGITTEQAGLDRPEAERFEFQKDLFMFYREQLAQVTTEAHQDGVGVLICDRSPYDHLAYCVYNAQNLMTQDDITNLLAGARMSFFTGLDSIPTYLVHFPVGMSWMTEATVADGMRYATPAKNLVIDSLIQNFISPIHAKISLADESIMVRGQRVVQFVCPGV